MDVQPVTLEGRHVRLVPMDLSHHAALSAIGLDPALWRYTTIRVETDDDMRRYLEAALAAQAAGTALPFVIELRATEEGTLRHLVLSEHKGPCDVRIFSIIASEWSAIRSRLMPGV